jgi:hypothetical protein
MPPRQVDTRLDADSLDAFVFDAGAEVLPGLSGEAFEGVTGGWGLRISTGVHFASGHAVRVRWTTESYSDTLAGGSARSMTLGLAAAWGVKLGSRLALEAGPAVGYAWLSRAFYRERARGPFVGVVVGVVRQVGERLQIRASALLDWYEFHHTSITGLPADPDGQALGTRLGLALGVGYASPL